MSRAAAPAFHHSRVFFLALALTFAGACGRVGPQSGQASPAPLPVFPADVEQLRGVPVATVARRLGEPDLVREEPPAVLWQYRSHDCVLELFFYRGGNELDVAYAEAHPRGLIRVSQSDCYADLVSRRSRPL
ncbi:MAG TPA: hypothetical protein VKU84_05165 [Stellaceae bacterium]|nr:hypothetical protein [Stellaceae bacterium]